MRNLEQYPVTQEEMLHLLEDLYQEMKAEAERQCVIGNTDLVVMDKIIKLVQDKA